MPWVQPLEYPGGTGKGQGKPKGGPSAYVAKCAPEMSAYVVQPEPEMGMGSHLGDAFSARGDRMLSFGARILCKCIITHWVTYFSFLLLLFHVCIQAAVGKWANFAVWNQLFLTNPNLGAGGMSLDTVSSDDDTIVLGTQTQYTAASGASMPPRPLTASSPSMPPRTLPAPSASMPPQTLTASSTSMPPRTLPGPSASRVARSSVASSTSSAGVSSPVPGSAQSSRSARLGRSMSDHLDDSAPLLTAPRATTSRSTDTTEVDDEYASYLDEAYPEVSETQADFGQADLTQLDLPVPEALRHPAPNPITDTSRAPTPVVAPQVEALAQKEGDVGRGARRRRAQTDYVSSVTDVQVRLTEIEQNTRLRELEFEERRVREQRQWQHDLEQRRQDWEEERERRRERHELRMERERNERETERMERESRLRRQEMEFQYNLFHSDQNN